MIIIVFGLPSSGKSYFASHLAEMINGAYINSDKVRKKMFDKRIYTTEEKQMVYDKMLIQMQEAVKQHRDIVLDATFYKNKIRRKFIEGAKNLDEMIFIKVQSRRIIDKRKVTKSQT